MTTEQCSVDSLLPKSRTETFARQLQNRLRTLNNDIDRDGPDDTSWNGDQLSSSSDDIYYDLDSPGSPAEEATETNFTDYINATPPESAYPSSSSKDSFNHTECSLRNGKENCIDYGYTGQYSMADSINHSVNNKSAKCVCLNQSERKCSFCGHCAKENYDEKTISTTIDKVNNVPYYNGLSHQNHFYSNGKNHELLADFNGINSNDDLLQQTRSDVSETPITNFNGIKDRLQSNGECDGKTPIFIVKENETKNFTDGHPHNFNLYSCSTFNNELKSIDINYNSTASMNNMNNTTSAIDIKSRNGNNDLNGALDYDYQTNFKVNFPSCIKPEVKHKKETYTEEDLSRLVDAVFLRSQENDFDEDSCRQTMTNTEKSNNQNENSNDEEETIESKRSRFRRSSSLKTGKTPPGTPGCKKIVRFADVLGLDLADVRTFLDEIPKVPKSAFTDLKDVELSSSPPVTGLDAFIGYRTAPSVNVKMQRTIVPLFQQPSIRPEFLDRVRDNFVCLENAVITDPALSIVTGIVRVKNIDFHKSVHIRYSIDNWKSFADLQGKYVPNSCDGFSDRFTFVLYAHMLNVGQRLEFAIRYHSSGSIFWDNNFGANYLLQCVPDGPSKVLPTTSYPTAGPTETWASFY